MLGLRRLLLLLPVLATVYTTAKEFHRQRFHCYYSLFRGLPTRSNPDLKALNGTCTDVYLAYLAISVLGRSPFITTIDQRDLVSSFVEMKEEMKWRVHATITGDDGGKHFLSITDGGSESIRRFACECVRFAREKGFDGLDVHWKFPKNRQANFTQVLKALYEEIQKDDSSKEKLILTASLSSHEPTALVSYEFEELRKYLDYYHIMTFDMWDTSKKVLGIHTRMDKFQGDDNLYSDWLAAYSFWSEKAPLDKMLFGFAFYGRSFKIESENRHYPGDDYLGEAGDIGPAREEIGVLYYSSICKLINETGWKATYVPRAGAYFAFGKRLYPYRSHWEFVGYDGLKSAQAKADFIRERNMTGLFGWRLEGDDVTTNDSCGRGPFGLARAVNLALKLNYTITNHTDIIWRERNVSSGAKVFFSMLFAKMVFVLFL